MSKVYAVAKLNITDPETYQVYNDGFFATLEGTGGKLIGFDEPPVAMEGSFDGTRLVLLEFPSQEALKSWYDSDAYQAILPYRQKASTADIWMLNAFDPAMLEG